MTYFHRVHRQTLTRFWINNPTEDQADLAINAGAVGSTHNPSYLLKLYNAGEGNCLREKIDEMISLFGDDRQLALELQRKCIQKICKKFYPVYEQSGGRYGLVSIQGDPGLEYTENILENAQNMLEKSPNVIVQVPGTKEGLIAIRELLQRRIPVLATQVMSIDQVIDLCRIYQETVSNNVVPVKLMIAQITGTFDEEMEEQILLHGYDVPPRIYHQGAWFLSHRIQEYIALQEIHGIEYLAGGTGKLNHFTSWVGSNGGITINWDGVAEKLLQQDSLIADGFNCGIPVDELNAFIQQVPDFRKAYEAGSMNQDDYQMFAPVARLRNRFESGWNDMLIRIRERRERLSSY